MSVEDIQKNNPLHGLKLEALLTDLVKHYGWPILAEYTRINCFQQNPSMASSVKFLRKNLWAQEKLEAFYLYKFKSLPRPSDSEYDLPPRQRTIPSHLEDRPPVELKLGESKPVVDKGPANNRRFFEKRNAEFANGSRPAGNDKRGSHSAGHDKRDSRPAKKVPSDPWANFTPKKD